MTEKEYIEELNAEEGIIIVIETDHATPYVKKEITHELLQSCRMGYINLLKVHDNKVYEIGRSQKWEMMVVT